MYRGIVRLLTLLATSLIRISGDRAKLSSLLYANQDSNELTVLLNRTCNNVLLGDVNGDGDVDSLDINSFVQLIISSQFECSLSLIHI